MDHLKTRSAGIQQGQGKRGLHWRGGCRGCFVLCFCPGKGLSRARALRWRQQRQARAQRAWEGQGPESKISSLRFVFYPLPPLHRLGPFHLSHQIRKIFNWKQKISCEVIVIFLKSSNCQAASKTLSLQRSTFWKMQCSFNEFIVHDYIFVWFTKKYLFFYQHFWKASVKCLAFNRKVNKI